MRTTLDINMHVLKEVMLLSKSQTKKEAVNLSLKAFLRQKHLENLARRLGAGKHSLTAQDLKTMRSR